MDDCELLLCRRYCRDRCTLAHALVAPVSTCWASAMGSGRRGRATADRDGELLGKNPLPSIEQLQYPNTRDQFPRIVKRPSCVARNASVCGAIPFVNRACNAGFRVGHGWVRNPSIAFRCRCAKNSNGMRCRSDGPGRRDPQTRPAPVAIDDCAQSF